MSTYVPIQAITLSASAASVTFTGIPQTFTDLVIATSTASDLSSGSEHILCRFNSDSGSNYSATYLYGTGSSALSGRNSNTTGAFIGRHEQTEFGTGITHIQNYSNTTTNKTVLSRGGLAGQITIAYVSTWRNTAAITSITLTPNGASNFDSGSTFTLYGVGSGSPKAFGGDEVRTDGTYWYHIFRSSGRFETVQALSNVDFLVVAGGGGGGAGGGGGGAGGYRCSVTGENSGGGASAESKLTLNAGNIYTVTVGGGGTGGASTFGGNGTNSVFSTITSTGGGGGGSQYDDANSRAGKNGGSGGGGGQSGAPSGGPFLGGSPTTGQGYAGGSGQAVNAAAGGGGGAGAVGGNASGLASGAGGNGVASSITGSSVTRGGGGGGGGSDFYNTTGGAGGTGGGGANTGTAALNVVGSAGTANTGGGGGGGSQGLDGGNGGSGIIIVRYAV